MAVAQICGNGFFFTTKYTKKKTTKHTKNFSLRSLCKPSRPLWLIEIFLSAEFLKQIAVSACTNEMNFFFAIVAKPD